MGDETRKSSRATSSSFDRFNAIVKVASMVVESMEDEEEGIYGGKPYVEVSSASSDDLRH